MLSVLTRRSCVVQSRYYAMIILRIWLRTAASPALFVGAQEKRILATWWSAHVVITKS